MGAAGREKQTRQLHVLRYFFAVFKRAVFPQTASQVQSRWKLFLYVRGWVGLFLGGGTPEKNKTNGWFSLPLWPAAMTKQCML